MNLALFVRPSVHSFAMQDLGIDPSSHKVSRYKYNSTISTILSRNCFPDKRAQKVPKMAQNMRFWGFQQKFNLLYVLFFLLEYEIYCYSDFL